MPLKKFGANDVILNTLEASPHCEFFVYDGNIYYNNIPSQAGTMTTGPSGSGKFDAVSQVRMVPTGHISLYEYNIDRPNTALDDRMIGSAELEASWQDTSNTEKNSGEPMTRLLDTGRIYPWVSKDSAGSSFKTINATGYANEFQFGDLMSGSYPLSASIVRELVTNPSASLNAHFYSLKNKLDFYGVRSQQYLVSSSYGNKNIQTLNLISIPSIFFGSRIRPGSVSLKWYYTGSLAGELQDTRQNGELIQCGPPGSDNSGSVAGVILYDEGYIVLTGSWQLNDQTTTLDGGGQSPAWIRYGVGANDGVSPSNNASFNLSFKGKTKTQVMTLFTHAKRGEANFSNNPTYLQYGQDKIQRTSSHVYEENSEQLIANTVSSSYNGFDAPFKRSVYISRIAIYDENKNIIGIATLANPVLKEEDQDYSFKLKLDM